MLSRKSLSLFAALVLLSSVSFAGVITGRVVDFTGAGVANVNIDADFSSGGGSPTVTNGGTDANGYFTTTITPNGVFDIEFSPPPPPATTHLPLGLADVSVVGTLDLGTLVLPRGYPLAGRLVNAAGVGVSGVNVDVLDAAGNQVVLQNDASDALGQFQVAVPAGNLTLQLDTNTVFGQVLAPKQLAASVSGPLDVGVVTLAPGFTLSGTVKRTNLVPVADVDLDVYDNATGAKLFTPGDDTTSTGTFSVIVPAGTHDVRFCPPFAQLLVATEFLHVVVSSSVSFGNVLLQGGVILSGTVSAFDGAKHANVDVDVFHAGTAVGVVLCADNTNAAGAYQVVVPTGTYDVRFAPPYTLPLASKVVTGVVVGANKILDGTLPACPFYVNTGSGSAGSGGVVPSLTATGGAPRLGNPDYALRVSNGLGGATAFFLWGPPWRTSGPFPSSTFIPTGAYRALRLSGPSGVAGAGTGTFSMPIGGSAALAGLPIYVRAYVVDPAANGHAFTPVLQATLKP